MSQQKLLHNAHTQLPCTYFELMIMTIITAHCSIIACQQSQSIATSFHGNHIIYITAGWPVLVHIRQTNIFVLETAASHCYQDTFQKCTAA